MFEPFTLRGRRTCAALTTLDCATGAEFGHAEPVVLHLKDIIYVAGRAALPPR